jgi:hypothetical protein
MAFHQRVVMQMQRTIQERDLEVMTLKSTIQAMQEHADWLELRLRRWQLNETQIATNRQVGGLKAERKLLYRALANMVDDGDDTDRAEAIAVLKTLGRHGDE